MYKKVFYKCFPVLPTIAKPSARGTHNRKVHSDYFPNAPKDFCVGFNYVQILMLK